MVDVPFDLTQVDEANVTENNDCEVCGADLSGSQVLTSSYIDVRKTLDNITGHFYWPSIRQDVNRILAYLPCLSSSGKVGQVYDSCFFGFFVCQAGTFCSCYDGLSSHLLMQTWKLVFVNYNGCGLKISRCYSAMQH